MVIPRVGKNVLAIYYRWCLWLIGRNKKDGSCHGSDTLGARHSGMVIGYGVARQHGTSTVIDNQAASGRNSSLQFHDEQVRKVHFTRSSFSHLDKWSAYFRCCDYQRYYQSPPILSFLILFLLSQCKMTRQSISNPVI